MGKSYYEQLVEINKHQMELINNLKESLFENENNKKEEMKKFCEETSEHLHYDILAFADKLCDEVGCSKDDNSPFDSVFCKRIEDLITRSLYEHFENKGK